MMDRMPDGSKVIGEAANRGGDGSMSTTSTDGLLDDT